MAGRSITRPTLAALALVLAARTARAQDATGAGAPEAADASPTVTEARRHYAQGAALFARENFDAALAEFQQAYDLLAGNPRQYAMLFNLAQCHERLFRYDAALTYYRRYLTEGGDAAEDRASVEATMHALESLLATLHIRSNVPHAEVWVDERRVGDAPGDLRVPGGRHVVQLRAPGYAPSQQEVVVSARAERELRYVLEPLSHGISPVFFATGLGIAAVAGGIGFGFGAHALALSSDAKMRLMDPALMWTVTHAEQAAVRQAALTADVFYLVGGAFLIGSGVLLFLTDWHGRPRAEAAPSVRPTAMLVGAGAGVGVVGVFQ